MEKNILEGVKLEFKDLSAETQKRLYLENREKFKKEAAKSQYNYVREFLIRDEETDSKTLDELFKVETNTQNILKLLKHPNFQMNDETKKKLSKSDNWKLRELAAKDETNTSEFLNQMLRNEIEGVQDEDVINAILNNLNFKMEEETRKKAPESDNWRLREFVAKDEESTSEFLNQMLRNEIEGVQDEDFIDAILNNLNFKMDEETREKLSETEDWERRIILAKYKKNTSEDLNQMLQKEIDYYDDPDVIYAILNNLNFKMEEETRKKLSESINAVFRKIIAEDEETSAQLLESMYWKEQEPNILEILEKRLGEKMKSNTLNIVQRKKIFKVLKEVQSSNKKEPLAKYLEQILEIIG